MVVSRDHRHGVPGGVGVSRFWEALRIMDDGRWRREPNLVSAVPQDIVFATTRAFWCIWDSRQGETTGMESPEAWREA
jgi:hypothetical protein